MKRIWLCSVLAVPLLALAASAIALQHGPRKGRKTPRRNSSSRTALVGTWNGEALIKGRKVDPQVRSGFVYTLHLRPNGTYTSHFELRVMMSIVSDGSGSFSVENQSVILRGTEASTTDDGYKKGKSTDNVNRTLLYKSGKLHIQDAEVGWIFTKARAK